MITNNAIKYGLMGGFFGTSFLTLLYVISPSLLIGIWRNGTWLVLAGFMSLTIAKDRAILGGFISFRAAVSTAFATFVIGLVILILYNYFMFKFYDKSLVEIIRQTYVDFQVAHYDGSNPLKQEQELKNLKVMDLSPKLFDTGNLLYFILGFVISALLAAIFKREKPSFLED